MKEPERLAALRELDEQHRSWIKWHWRIEAREKQLSPEGDWSIWLLLAGRGFGKTRAGSEWVREVAMADPAARIALVGSSLGDVRAVMVEGESGVLSVTPPNERPRFESSLHRLTFPNGAQAMLYSAGEPDSLRGPQHSHACRPGAERSLCQRGACADRRAPSLFYRRCRHIASCFSCGRCQLVGGCFANRRLGRTCGQNRLPPGRKLAVRCSA